jgi:poly(hydroxyalkanoate) depolymerase family esterase
MLERSLLGTTAKRVSSNGDPNATPGRALRPVQPSRVRERRMSTPALRVASPVSEVIEGRFESPRGALEYRLYPPASRSGGETSLVLMLHAAGQDPADFALGTRMHEHSIAEDMWVLYPGQDRDVPMRCWNWFAEGHQMRSHGEPALLAALTRFIASERDISRRRIYAAGLSAGGAMAVVLGQTYPDVYAAVGAHSGLPYAAASNVYSALDAMVRGPAGASPRQASARVPTIVFHGDADIVVHPDNAHAIVADVVDGCATTGRPIGKTRRADGGERAHTITTYPDSRGNGRVEQWIVHDAGHAWSGGSADGSYTDAAGPDATGAMLRFFRSHRLEPRCAR